MSLYSDIRGALQTQLGGVSGIPTIAYEGVPFTPVIGTAFCECVLVPTQARPVTMGGDHLIRHQGTFEVSLVYPSGFGTGTAENKADDVKAAFPVDTSLTQDSTTIRIRFAERRQVLTEADWIRVPVSIGWYLFTTTY